MSRLSVFCFFSPPESSQSHLPFEHVESRKPSVSELAYISIRFGMHSALPVTLGTLLRLCRSIVSAFIACWLTKTSHCTRLRRERDTVTVTVSHDRAPVWSAEEQCLPTSISLITLFHSEKLQIKGGKKSSGDQAREYRAVPGMIEWSAEIWWAQTIQGICHQIQRDPLFNTWHWA